MNTKDENVLLKAVKKAVGLPTGNSSCGCSAPVSSTKECCQPEPAERASTDCGCESTSAQEKEQVAETA